MKEQMTAKFLVKKLNSYIQLNNRILQCWTKGQSSTAIAEDLGLTATATAAEV